MPEVAHLSSLAGSPLLDSENERLGKVDDVVASLDSGDGLPLVIGLTARIGGREMFVPIGRIQQLGPHSVQTATTKLNLAQFERRPGEVLLRGEVLDHSLINVDTARLVRAREVDLVHEDDGTWRVAGIDPAFVLACGAFSRAATVATTPSTSNLFPGATSSRSSGTCPARA